MKKISILVVVLPILLLSACGLSKNVKNNTAPENIGGDNKVEDVNKGASSENMVGNDRDEHGCIGSAGYSWCEAKKKCLRTWEEACEITGETRSSQQAAAPAVTAPVPVVDKMAMVDCGSGDDPFCFLNRMNECLPVTIQMMGSDQATKIVMTILGIEDGKCHFQRKINDVLNLNCFFPKGTMNQDTLDQTFGNERGLQKVVDDACKSGW